MGDAATRLAAVLQSEGDFVARGDAACRIIAEHLDVARVVYVRIVPGAYEAECEHCRDIFSIRGKHPVVQFSEVLRNALLSGGLRAFDDVLADPFIPDRVRPVFAKLGIRAYMALAPVDDDMGLCGLGVHSSVPRAWNAEETAWFEKAARLVCGMRESERRRSSRL